MEDVKCPYCGKEQEINHDDGYGYDDGKTFEQQCDACNEYFDFETTIIYSYDVYCKADDHKMEQSPIKKHKDLWGCANCDYYELRRETGTGEKN
ncbi:MAG: hypothetical protein GY820_38500 [Gammaproteobacteria bacterium]|nr:hypothetical protein [Gammaproteobacteria bacterium]